MVTLTEKEDLLVAKYRVHPSPKYYSSTERTEIPISPDMEAFIILSPPESRNNVIQWTNKTTQNLNSSQDHDSLLRECLQYESDVSQKQLSELNNAVLEYDRFKDSFFKNVLQESTSQGSSKQERFGGVPEVGQVLLDMEITMDELVARRSRAKHLNTLMKLFMSNLVVKGITQDQRREINSWAGPFSAYKNGAT